MVGKDTFFIRLFNNPISTWKWNGCCCCCLFCFFPRKFHSLFHLTMEFDLEFIFFLLKNDYISVNSPLSLTNRICDMKKQRLVIIDDSPIDWAFVEGILRPSIFPTIEDALFQNKVHLIVIRLSFYLIK